MPFLLLKFSHDNLVNSCVLNFSLQNSFQFLKEPTLGLSFSKVVFMTVTVILWKSDSPVSTADEF